MSEEGDFEIVPQPGEEWLIENPGASRLVRVRVVKMLGRTACIEEWGDDWGYKVSRQEWVSRDRVRFVEKFE